MQGVAECIMVLTCSSVLFRPFECLAKIEDTEERLLVQPLISHLTEFQKTL